MTTHFWYSMSFSGKWVPNKSPSAPIINSANGNKNKIHGHRFLEDGDEYLTLDELMRKYPPSQGTVYGK